MQKERKKNNKQQVEEKVQQKEGLQCKWKKKNTDMRKKKKR